jgi:acetyl/propionyl-CoA carboxylase alpha subunit
MGMPALASMMRQHAADIRASCMQQLRLLCHLTPVGAGYGFLSERAEFVEICNDHGIEFIGPKPIQIRLMGDKSTAKDTMKVRGGVPGSAMGMWTSSVVVCFQGSGCCWA